MNTTQEKASVDERLEQGQQLLDESAALRAEARSFMDANGIKYPLHEWITIKNYAEKHGHASTSRVSKWIMRGIIPPEDILELPELNGIRLIRDKPYMDGDDD